MATTKTFTIAGVSTLNGKTKIRWANDSMRIKQLIKHGHQNIDLITLPHPMTKGEIAQHLKATGYGNTSPDIQSAIEYAIQKNPITVDATAVAEPVAA